MSRRLLLALSGVVGATLALAEVLLRPPADDRLHLLVILAVPAVVAVAATPLLSRWVSRRASVAGAVLAVALCSLSLGAATSSAASNAMFVSSHDFRLFIVVLLLSCGIALVVGSQLTRPLARDIRRLGHVAQRVADGDLGVRTDIERNDEVGATAAAIDRMIDALAAAELDRAKMTEARQHLFTSIGHDLRTPLSAMRAAVESLEDGIAPDPARYYALLAAQLSAVDALLEQLVELARLESGHTIAVRERVSLTELADECAEALCPLAARRAVRIVVESTGPAVVDGNPLELTRVLRNLVDNAVRHSPDGGTVRIAIDRRTDAHAADDRRADDRRAETSADHRAEPTADHRHGTVAVSVTDDGDGFPAAFREHAFEPFTRADPSRNARTGNTGLGLAICRAIVSVHHGEIWLGAGPGGDVRFTLPSASPFTRTDRRTPTTTASTTHRSTPTLAGSAGSSRSEEP